MLLNERPKFRSDGLILWHTWRVCEVLQSHPDGVNMTQMIAYTNSNYASVKRVTDIMVRKGLLEFVSGGRGRGKQHLFLLTAKSQTLLQHYRGIKRLLR